MKVAIAPTSLPGREHWGGCDIHVPRIFHPLRAGRYKDGPPHFVMGLSYTFCFGLEMGLLQCTRPRRGHGRFVSDYPGVLDKAIIGVLRQ